VLASRVRRILGWVIAGLVVVGACSGRGSGEPASRLLAVHNVMRATGRTLLGPVSQGSLAEGQEARFALNLGAACATIVAFGGPGTRDLALKLLGPDGKVVAQESAFDAQAVLTACAERPGEHVVVVTMTQGSGDYVASSFSGGEEPTVGDAGSAPGAAGTCEAPVVLVPGRPYAGSTANAPDEHKGSCGNSSGRERVHRLDITSRQRVSIEVDARYDSVLYVRKGDCTDEDAEIKCNDDSPGGAGHSKVAAVLDPGTYYVIVDGYGDEGGSYQLRTSVKSAPSVQEICAAAHPLAAAATVAGNLADAFDNAHATCGGGADGPDAVYRLDLAARSRVRLAEKSSDFRPVIHVRSACEDDKTLIGCAGSGNKQDEAVWAGVLDAGTYWVYADSPNDEARGAFTLSAETAPAGGVSTGNAVKGDACGDAIALGAAAGTVESDTFLARDDAAVSCGRPGAADVIYRIDLAHKSRVTARINSDEASHVLGLTKSCADRAAEIVCGRTLDRVLDPGTYFFVVDAKSADSMGRFSVAYRIHDMVLAEAACANALPLAIGRTVNGTTVGAGNRFTPGCGSAEESQWAPDRVYRFKVDRRMSATFTLEKGDAHATLSVRKTCADSSTDVRCADSPPRATRTQQNNTLEPGTYYAVVDLVVGERKGGPFTLRIDSDEKPQTRSKSSKSAKSP
jgi:hypothetical protein